MGCPDQVPLSLKEGRSMQGVPRPPSGLQATGQEAPVGHNWAKTPGKVLDGG